jgi:hypothetical protein
VPDTKKGVSKERSALVNGSIGVAKWVVRPGFTKEFSNPFQGVGGPSATIPKRRKRQGYTSWEEALASNPELEAVREIAMPVLKRKRLVAIVCIVLWQYLYHSWLGQSFPLQWMNNVIYSLFTFVSLTFLFHSDYQFTMFNKKRVGMSFFGWIRYRLGGR